MAPSKFEMPSHKSACSFQAFLHEEYEAIRAECDPWILALTEPTSPAAAEFWVDCLFPLLACLAYAECSADRMVHITKYFAWFFVSDDEDDEPALLGRSTVEAPVSRRRHELILACCSGDLLVRDGVDSPRTVKEMQALHGVCQAMLKDMSPQQQARSMELIKDYLNAVQIQAQYRSANRLPAQVDEFIALRRSASDTYVFCLLIEYGLGIELDQETLDSQLFIQLQEACVDHVALTNDLFSCHAEIASGDHFNLPSVIFFNSPGGPDFTFQDAMQRALDMVEVLDKRCVTLMAELQQSSLIQKPGVEAYIRGLQMFIAGNKAWSLTTARYKNKCAAAQGVVRAVDPALSPFKG